MSVPSEWDADEWSSPTKKPAEVAAGYLKAGVAVEQGRA
jgi:hypothetical protein